MNQRSRFSASRPPFHDHQEPPVLRDGDNYLSHRMGNLPTSRRRYSSDRSRGDLDREREIMDDAEEPGALYFSDCTMYPPREGRDKPVIPRTSKPNGCKTIFLGGIPEPMNRIPKRLEAILMEVFTANGGEVEVIRISGRGFCHIRFRKEESVDIAMSLTGYWMAVKQGYEPTVRFRVLLDYSESQNDAEEYETKKMIASRLNMQASDIPDIPPFSSSTVDALMLDLKNPDAYSESIVILRYWMCTHLNRQTSVRFFNLLQVGSTQIKRLQSEREQLDGEYDVMMERYQKNLSRFDGEFDHLMTLYEDARKQKLWDNFTRPQRKSIEGWLESIRQSLSSDDKEGKKSKTAEEHGKIFRVGFGNSSTNKNYVVLDNELQDEKDAKIKDLTESLEAVQKQVWEMVTKLQNKDLKLVEKQNEIDRLITKEAQPPKRKRKENETLIGPDDAKIMCASVTYMQAYPNGVNIQTLQKYLADELKIDITCNSLETKLLQMSDIFSKRILVENGNTISKWKYTMLQK